jgi:hypothetical protein
MYDMQSLFFDMVARLALDRRRGIGELLAKTIEPHLTGCASV